MQVNNVAWVECKFIDDRMDSSSYITQINMGLFDLYKKESTDFQIKTLDDICNKIIDGPFGSDILEEDYVEQGVPFIRVQNITEYGFEDSSLVFISEKANKRIIRSECRPGDLVFTKTGRLGTVCVLNNEYSNYNIRGDLAKLQLKSHIDPYYVMSYLNSNFGTKITNSYSSGSTRGRILISNIKKIFTPIPSPEIQKYIGDKVRKAEELREEAKRLKNEAEEIINKAFSFKELDLIYIENKAKFQWINTDILIDRIDGNYYEEKYIETINHMKRKSKNYVTLNSLIDSIYTGKKPIYDKKGADVCFVQSGNISSNFLEIDNKEKVDLSKYNQILFGDLLIAKDGETIGKIAINLTNETIIINEHTYCVRLKEEYKHYSAYIYYLLINDYINPLIRREATGSAQKGLNLSFTENIIIPDLEENIIMNLYNLELRRCDNIYKSKQLIQEAKQDVEDLIEGKFDMSKIKVNN